MRVDYQLRCCVVQDNKLAAVAVAVAAKMKMVKHARACYVPTAYKYNAGFVQTEIDTAPTAESVSTNCK